MDEMVNLAELLGVHIGALDEDVIDGDLRIDPNFICD